MLNAFHKMIFTKSSPPKRFILLSNTFFFLRVILTLLDQELHVARTYFLEEMISNFENHSFYYIVSFYFEGCSYDALIRLYPFPDQEFT
jgi:hypothetical protein